MNRIAVAMSGGVDSSTAAALLVEQGAQVFGLMLNLWSPDSRSPNRCCAPEAQELARQVAHKLEIPFYVLDAKQAFRTQVVEPFAEGYSRGITPNPCISCNRQIRWTYLLKRALNMGATHLATGHYARIDRTEGRLRLLRGVDRMKDQSYVLSFLSQFQLSKTLFPLGELTKSEVRQQAKRFNLPVADWPDSQDLCFISNGKYWNLLEEFAPDLPPAGEIVNLNGEVIGEHLGLARYTIGQRKGIGISGRSPLYVIEKDLTTNRLVVGPRSSLYRRYFETGKVNWIGFNRPIHPTRATTRIRHQARETQATLSPLPGGHVRVSLDSPIRSVTPGQAAVFYQEEVCLGGAIIEA